MNLKISVFFSIFLLFFFFQAGSHYVAQIIPELMNLMVLLSQTLRTLVF